MERHDWAPGSRDCGRAQITRSAPTPVAPSRASWPRRTADILPARDPRAAQRV